MAFFKQCYIGHKDKSGLFSPPMGWLLKIIILENPALKTGLYI